MVPVWDQCYDTAGLATGLACDLQKNLLQLSANVLFSETHQNME